MKILYAGSLTENDTALHRLWALERLGHIVIPFPVSRYESRNVLLRKIIFRVNVGPGVMRLNQDLLKVAQRERPDILWADKMLWIWPKTLRRLRSMGVALLSYMIDNPFGTRNDPGWRLYLQDIPEYDLHVVQRDRNLIDYRQRGARDVLKIQTAYEPTLNFPPPADWGDANRDRGVSFIGTPYDDRAGFLTRLWREYGYPITISGNARRWATALEPSAYAALFQSDELYQQAYREGIWKSKINLSFLTHSNQDEFAHKTFEIAGCGGFLLAERSPGHTARFVENEEAVFFSTVEECAAKIRQYLPDEAARNRIAALGRARAERDGYHNDGQMMIVMARLSEIIAAQHLS